MKIRENRPFVKQICFILVMAMLFYPGLMFTSSPVSAAPATPIISTIKNFGTQGITSDSLGNVYYVKTSDGQKIYKLSIEGAIPVMNEFEV